MDIKGEKRVGGGVEKQEEREIDKKDVVKGKEQYMYTDEEMRRSVCVCVCVCVCGRGKGGRERTARITCRQGLIIELVLHDVEDNP